MKSWLMAAVMVVFVVASAITPTGGGLAGGTRVTINAEAGDQSDPHVHGYLAAYTDIQSAGIRYYSFLTSTDQAVPTAVQTLDSLPDVFGTRISFSRLSHDRRAIMVYDTASLTLTEIAPQAGSSRVGTALGGDNIAFVDTSVGNGDVMVYDLSTSGPVVNVSAAVEIDRSPALSPAGDAIVWQQCAGSSIDCKIMKAQRTDGIWQTATVLADASGIAGERTDTDGTWVVYVSDRASATGPDIYFRALSEAGAETALEIAGVQRGPTISGGVIAFASIEATLSSFSDIYVYVIASNMLVRVTDTPAVSDFVNDVTVLANGDIRVVWAADDGSSGDYNIYAQTFTPPAGSPTITFGGFQPPLNGDAVNQVRAGAGVPVKFSLGGDLGLGIFASDYPKFEFTACSPGDPVDPVEETVSAGNSGLSYDAATGVYTYVWKTDKMWAGKCGTLIIKLTDNSEYTASFKFTK